MSPASTDGLYVERYIGSYLISNSARAADHRKYNPNTYNAAQRNKKPASKPIQFLGSPGVYPAGYVTATGLFQPHGYCQNQNTWTGVPLISTANRRNRKPHVNTPVQNSAQHYQRQPRLQIVDGSCNLDYEGQLPLSRLALHTRGAPLILSRRSNNNRKPSHCPNNNNNNYKHLTPQTLRPALPNKDFECKDQTNHSDVHRTLNIDSLSVTSDESSGSANSETCLPRIIKPRKRRKKDRKPPGAQEKSSQPIDNPKADSAHGVNPYQPFVSNNYSNDIADNPFKFSGKPGDDDTTSGKVRHNSEEADDDSDDSSSLFEAISRCSPTVCQCKYCDTSGQVWDFDRLCYLSLFSSECDGSDSSRDKSPQSSNPLTDKDSVLRRSWSEPCPGYSVESLRIGDYDKQSSPHRSDPNISSVCDQEHIEPVAQSAFGAIGTGRRGVAKDASALSDWKATTVPQSPEHVPDILFKCFPSRGAGPEASPPPIDATRSELKIKFFSTLEDYRENDDLNDSGYQCESKEMQPVVVQ